jgi:hypothetical protein
VKLVVDSDAELKMLGVDAARLLCAGQIDDLVARFGYARALGRPIADAVRADIAASLTELEAQRLGEVQSSSVKRFEPNSTGLVGVVEVEVSVDNGRSVVLELVVSGGEGDFHLTLEDVSAAT